MICERCGHDLQVGNYPFCRGRANDHGVGTALVIGDECDFVQHNGTREPIHFRSKADHRDWLKANSYQVYDTHVGETGSDKSKHTTNWARGYDPVTAENVRILLERAFTQKTTREAPLTMNIRTTIRDLPAEEAAQYVG